MTTIFIRINQLRVHRFESRLMTLNKAISAKLEMIAKIKLGVSNAQTVQTALTKSIVSMTTAEDLAAIDRIIDKRGMEVIALLERQAQQLAELESLYNDKRTQLKELSAAQAKLEQCMLLQKALETKRGNILTESNEQDILDVRAQGRQRTDAVSLPRG